MKRLHQDAVPGVVQAEGCIPDLSELGEDDSVYAEHIIEHPGGQMAETMACLFKVAGQLKEDSKTKAQCMLQQLDLLPFLVRTDEFIKPLVA